MKLKLLFFFVSSLLSSLVFTQNLTVSAPPYNGVETGARAPNGTAAQTTLRVHYIIPASELTGIPSGTVITGLGVIIDQPAVGSPTGNLNFYLENTNDVTNNKSVDWSIATTPMASVYNGPFPIPTTAGPADFTITNSFTYSGGGLYVAFEYIGTSFATTGATYFANSSLVNNCRSMATGTSTPGDSLNVVSTWRPTIRFSFANPFTNNMAVTGIRSNFGTVNPFMVNSTEVEVEVTNLGSQAATNIPVDLSIPSISSFSSSQTITSLASGASQTLTFTGVPIGNSGDQIVRATVPTDQQTINDTLEYTQVISCDSVGLVNSDSPTSLVGFGFSEGILAVRYDISNLVPVNIKTIDFMVGDNQGSIGNAIKGILLNSAGVMIDSTLPYTITSSDLGQRLSLSLLDGNTDYANQTVFAGIRQPATTTTVPYYPFTMQYQYNPPINKNAEFSINGGGAPTYQNGLYPLMILITVEPRPFTVFSNPSTTICTGNPVDIGLFPLVYDSYSIFENNVLVQNNTIGSFTLNPNATTIYDVMVEKNTCVGPTGTITVQVVSEYTDTLNETFCTGDPFNFNGTLLSASGQYADTLTASGGCDSIIVLNLTELSPSNFFITEDICSGETYTFGGQTLTTSGIYTDILTNAAGCDSTVTLDLTVGIDLSITSSGGILTVGASEPNTTYQWINCDNNTPIPGETAQSFDALSLGITGNYAVLVTRGNCSEQSPCMMIDFTGIESFIDADISIYPNPVVDMLWVDVNYESDISYMIYDLGGKHVQHGSLNKTTPHQINVNHLESGTYIIAFKSDNISVKKMFIKQ